MRTALAGAWCTALLLLPVAPAHASEEVGLSTDGSSWSSDLSRPLFDEAMIWVPGDSRTATFWVRNQAASAGRLSLGVLADDPDLLASRSDVTLAVRRDAGAWSRLAVDGHEQVVGPDVLGVSASTRLQVRVDFVATSPNRSQLDHLDLRFRVRLTEAGAAVVEQPHPVALPDTGGVRLPLLLLGVGLPLSGAALLLVTRSTSRKDRHVPTR